MPKFPWCLNGKFKKYPEKFADREHCVIVWESKENAKKYGYDPEKSDSEGKGRRKRARTKTRRASRG
jgi:hypothetical protein